ncbi:hypothetical protein PUN28_020599 [Cardiocondyla obscurior]|uniref:Uncharacterized protein n=1 Tax=Cardiocondyla obscurior TaxID=286306 RepID=A0AAW2E5D8_9HYME
MAEKHKNIFLKFCNVASCATKNRCIRDNSELSICTSRRNMAEKHKKFFYLQHSIVLLFLPAAEIWPKNEKKYFRYLATYIVRHLKICIRVYSEFSIFTSRRNKQKQKKFFNLPSIFTSKRNMAEKHKIFLDFQHSIVRHLKKMHTGLFRAFYFHQQTKYGRKT